MNEDAEREKWAISKDGTWGLGCTLSDSALTGVRGDVISQGSLRGGSHDIPHAL